MSGLRLLLVGVIACFATLASCKKSPPIHSHGMEISDKEISHLQGKAENGDSVSAMKLSNYYAFETHDEKLSEKWLRVAASLKNAEAQKNLAYLIKEYSYSPQPFGKTAEEAVLSLLKQSAETDGGSCYDLASAYAEGYFGEQNLPQARFYFLRGSEFNNRMSWTELSRYYRKGLGGPRNDREAYYWISLEARCVDPRSLNGKETWLAREEIASHLSLAQLEEEWKRVDAFISLVYANKSTLDSAPFLEGYIAPKLTAEGRVLSQEKEDKHRALLRASRASTSDP